MKIATDIGIISDTHSLLRPEATRALADCELILHAGDIGKPEVIRQLEQQATVIAIRGNVDTGPWAEACPDTQNLTVNGLRIHMVHRLQDLVLPESDPPDVVVYGHSHKPFQETRDGVLYFNPGSAGPRRFTLPVTVGRLSVLDNRVAGKIEELNVPKKTGKKRPH